MKELIDSLSTDKLHQLLKDTEFYRQKYNSTLQFKSTTSCYCFSPSFFTEGPHSYESTWKDYVKEELKTEITNIKENYINLLKKSLFAPLVNQQLEEDIFTNSFHVPANKNTIWILTVGTLIRYIWENPGRVNIMLHLYKLGFTPNVSLFFSHFIDEQNFDSLKIKTPYFLAHSLFPMDLNIIKSDYDIVDAYSYKIIITYKKIVEQIASYSKNTSLSSIFPERRKEILMNKAKLKNIETLSLEDARIFAINHFGDNE